MYHHTKNMTYPFVINHILKINAFENIEPIIPIFKEVIVSHLSYSLEALLPYATWRIQENCPHRILESFISILCPISLRPAEGMKMTCNSDY